jgi:hypothetical protein
MNNFMTKTIIVVFPPKNPIFFFLKDHAPPVISSAGRVCHGSIFEEAQRVMCDVKV